MGLCCFLQFTVVIQRQDTTCDLTTIYYNIYVYIYKKERERLKMDKSESTFLPLTLFFFPVSSSIFGCGESLNSASLSIFFTTLPTHMIKSKLINQLSKQQRFRYERGIKCYQVWGLWAVLIAAVVQWWPVVSGTLFCLCFCYMAVLLQCRCPSPQF